jgi:hypothetical protein
MPIIYNSKDGVWECQNLTPEEAYSMMEIGKQCVVEGLAHRFRKIAVYKDFLDNAPTQSYFGPV